MAPSPPTLARLASEWLDQKNTAKPSAATMAARRSDLAAVGRLLAEHHGFSPAGTSDTCPGVSPDPEDPFQWWLSLLTPVHLTREAVLSAFAAFARTHAPASIRRCRSTWMGFCRWLVTHRELLEVNPVEFVEPPKARRWRPLPLSEEDLARVVAAAQTPYERARRPWAELERALCALFVGAGLRVSEAMSLRVGDVRRSPTEHTKLSVTGKGGVTRTVPVPPEVTAVLDEYLESRRQRLGGFQPTDRLLVRPDGRPLTHNAVDHLVRGWFRRAGVAPPPGALAHSLRHTYATLLVEQSGSVPEVQRLLGHADMSTTQAYIDVAARGVEETALANPARRMLARPAE